MCNLDAIKIVVDFSGLEGQNLTMKQTNAFADIDYVGYDKIMQFRVGDIVSDETGNGPLPDTLVSLDLPEYKAELDKNFVFGVTNRTWTINKVTFADVENSEITPLDLGKRGY